MDTLWRAYKGITPDVELAQKNKDNEWEREALSTLEPKNRPPPKPSDILKGFFTEFSDIAK